MGFIVPVVVVVIDVVIVACSNRHGDGILTEAGFNKTKQRDPSQRSSQSESNFRRHAGDENGLFRVTQAFLLQFCNLSWRTARRDWFKSLRIRMLDTHRLVLQV